MFIRLYMHWAHVCCKGCFDVLAAASSRFFFSIALCAMSYATVPPYYAKREVLAGRTTCCIELELCCLSSSKTAGWVWHCCCCTAMIGTPFLLNQSAQNRNPLVISPSSPAFLLLLSRGETGQHKTGWLTHVSLSQSQRSSKWCTNRVEPIFPEFRWHALAAYSKALLRFTVDDASISKAKATEGLFDRLGFVFDVGALAIR